MLALACGWTPAEGRTRYDWVREPGMRSKTYFVRERASGLVVHLHCELRAPVARPPPEPPHRPEHGSLLAFTQFFRLSMGSGDFVPDEFAQRDGYRIWLGRRHARQEDLDGRAALGVQVSWPRPESAQVDREPMEVFRQPRLRDLAPYEWSPWRRADELRGGAFAGWVRLHGVTADTSQPGDRPAAVGDPAQLPNPFELRCRAVLAEELYPPAPEDDPNIARPDPRSPR